MNNQIFATVDIPRDCAINIALDEIFFTNDNFIPIIRFYRWTTPSYTIGYFQKKSEIVNPNKYNIIRRLTGGLAVLHNEDLSYSFIVSDKQWNYIYDQEKSYKIIHSTMKEALADIDIICDNKQAQNLTPNKISCVNTFYKDDIFFKGKKLIGSCQRRRGKKILIEGSIHLKMTQQQIEKFTDSFFNKISNYLKWPLNRIVLDNKYIELADILVKNKYNSDEWINLF